MPVVKVKKGWRIHNVKGISPTKKKAEERLRAIKANQNKK